MDNLVKYTLKQKYGIDDLKGLCAYRGNSQGNDSGSNVVHSDKTSGGWMSYVFDVPETQEAIDAEVKARKLWNENYIEELKKSGKYGTEYEVNVSFVKHPLFDEPPRQLMMSSKMIIFDLNENNSRDDKT